MTGESAGEAGGATGSTSFDVVALGEVLVEVATEVPVAHGVPAVVGISGDALNVAASAAAAGARTGLVAVLPDDELGRAISDRIAALGISTELLRHRPGQQGMYLVHSDPSGGREFNYARSGSVGSCLAVTDLPLHALAGAGAVVASGISWAISDSARAAVRRAAEVATRFVYDPNFRPRLTSAAEASRALVELAPHAFLVTPSGPGETTSLLDRPDAVEAARRLRELGAQNVAVTCGASGVQLVGPDLEVWIDAVPAPRVVDQTGAGDAFVGTLAARVVLGDDLEHAARLAAAAASLVVGGAGGTGLVPTLEQTRRHLASASPVAP
jgi:2-dehydro-3-deoxygluconokinase